MIIKLSESQPWSMNNFSSISWTLSQAKNYLSNFSVKLHKSWVSGVMHNYKFWEVNPITGFAKGLFINDVTQIWTFSEKPLGESGNPLPPLSQYNGYFTYNLRPSVTNVLIPPPPTCVRSFMNAPQALLSQLSLLVEFFIEKVPI